MPLIRTASGRAFPAHDNESLLDAALRADITLPYSCHTGRCSTCKARVTSGSTSCLRDEPGLTQEEVRDGWILTCVRAATSDVSLDVQDLTGVHMPPARTLPCRISVLELVAEDVLRVVLRMPPASDLKYLPGQYVDIIGHEGIRRSYSLANAPRLDKTIELHIRKTPGGVMSEYWFERAQLNDLLRLHGPLGTFFLRDIEGAELVFLATGTGIAPVKAMLEGLTSGTGLPAPQSVSVFWGGRQPQDVYWTPSAEHRVDEFVPVLSRANEGWSGSRGHVQQAFMARRPNLANVRVFACGSDAMIHDARRELVAAGLNEHHFHSDAFVCSATT